MRANTKILFTDTNAFLQVRDLKDLPWTTLFSDVEAIDLMVAPRVIEELDRHKTSTNQRRRDRARGALHAIEKASLSSDLALTIREQPVRVRIVISRAPHFDWPAHPTLDPAKADDQLVAEAISFGQGAEIFSHDAGPRIRARVMKLKAHEPPADWLLPDEKTDDQRKITKLERDIEALSNRTPRISAGFDAIDDTTSDITLVQPILKPLAPDVADELSAAYLAAHPPANMSGTDNRFLRSLGAISESDAERYQSKYSTFEASVRDYYQNLHKRVQRVGLVMGICYFVKSEGGAAAEGLRIEFDLTGNASLIADRVDASRFVGLFKEPQPPDEPRSASDFHSLLPHAPSFTDVMSPRDPVAFYWFDRPKVGSKHSALQCQDFRAMREFRDEIFILSHERDTPIDLQLSLHVSATNLAAPVKSHARLILAKAELEWDDPIVQSIVPPSIRRRILGLNGN
jgi:hypothetical protein